MSTKKRQKIPLEPLPPPPPETREQVTASFVRYLTDRVRDLAARVEKWKERIANSKRLTSDLDWSSTLFEDAAKLAAYSETLDALTAQDSKATLDTVAEFVTKKAIDSARFPSRSSSPISNFNHECATAAWASLADDIRGWATAAKAADEHYGPTG